MNFIAQETLTPKKKVIKEIIHSLENYQDMFSLEINLMATMMAFMLA